MGGAVNEKHNKQQLIPELAGDSAKDAFPVILHRMLDEVEGTGHTNIISWNPDGRSFTVHQPKAFADTLMSKYFNQTRYKSFQRQLNLYHFSRETEGKIKGIYSHRCFVRDNRALCKFVRRSSKKRRLKTTTAPKKTWMLSTAETCPVPSYDRRYPTLSTKDPSTRTLLEPLLYTPLFGGAETTTTHHEDQGDLNLAIELAILFPNPNCPPQREQADDLSIGSIPVDGIAPEEPEMRHSLEGFTWVAPDGMATNVCR